jgi:hypothetical protein
MHPDIKIRNWKAGICSVLKNYMDMNMNMVATYENKGEKLTCPRASMTASHSSVNGTKFFK